MTVNTEPTPSQDPMRGAIHFISGLPRSGSTLLSALLRQNPRFTAGMTSPVGHLFNSTLRETSQRHEDSVYVDNALRERLLRSVFDAYYNETGADQVVFDTNRVWTTKMTALSSLFPTSRMICCVRNPAWIIDSIENLIRSNPLELSGIFGYETGGTVYSRAEGLASPNGLAGYAFNALREAIYGPLSDRLLLVRYESLVSAPLPTLAKIHDFIGEPMAEHNAERIEPCEDMIQFDQRLGTPGLHDVGSRVQARERPTLLPPDMFEQYSQQEFWMDPNQIPPSVRVI